jgi:hypothetical protein
MGSGRLDDSPRKSLTMSRRKSPATLERERDREIRRKRRAVKRSEWAKRRAERLARQARRETIRNGGPILVEPDPEADPCYRALRNFHPLRFCESCREIKREDWMKTETICIGCYEGGESEKTNQATMEGASSAPGQGKKGTAQPRRQAGQQELMFEF